MIASSSASHSVTGLDKDNNYVIRLRATGSGRATSAWAQSSLAVLSAPGKPTNLSVAVGRLGRGWTAPNDTGNGGGGITKYGLQCRRGTTGTPSNQGETTNTYTNVGNNFDCTQSFNNEGNFFRIRAFNLIWGAWSDWYQIQ